MKIELNKETIKVFGETGLKIGKHIVIEGTKVIALKAAQRAINVGFDQGFGSIKDITVDEVLESDFRGRTKQPKKKFFSKTKQEMVEDSIEEIVEHPEAAEDVVTVVEDEK
jgi:hypothetical protein